VGRSLKIDKAEQYSLASLKQSQADPKTLIKLESIKKSFMEKVHTKVAAEEELKELTEKQKVALRK
jgi:alpha-mannosidase